MRKITEKVAIVALVCIALVFVVTTVLYMAGVIALQENWAANGVSGPLVIVLAVLFAGLSAYLIYENFSTHANVKRVLLYCDSESATSADRRVVTNIVNGCAKQVEGIKVKKTRIAADDKQGFVLTLNVVSESATVQKSLDTLRCMLDESFRNTLGLKFNAINFVVDKLAAKFTPDVKHAEEMAENLADQREVADEHYHDPLNKCDCPDETAADTADDSQEQTVDIADEPTENTEEVTADEQTETDDDKELVK